MKRVNVTEGMINEKTGSENSKAGLIFTLGFLVIWCCAALFMFSEALMYFGGAFALMPFLFVVFGISLASFTAYKAFSSVAGSRNYKKCINAGRKSTGTIFSIKKNSVGIAKSVIIEFRNDNNDVCQCLNILPSGLGQSLSEGQQVTIFIYDDCAAIDIDVLMKNINFSNMHKGHYEDTKGTLCACGRFVEDGLLYCPSCGREVVKKNEETKKKIRFCEQCGSEIILSDSKFCPNCGAKIKDTDSL